MSLGKTGVFWREINGEGVSVPARTQNHDHCSWQNTQRTDVLTTPEEAIGQYAQDFYTGDRTAHKAEVLVGKP